MIRCIHAFQTQTIIELIRNISKHTFMYSLYILTYINYYKIKHTFKDKNIDKETSSIQKMIKLQFQSPTNATFYSGKH